MEAEKTTMFRQMNLEKPSKWFLNLTSDKKAMDSPSNILEKKKKSTKTEMNYIMMSMISTPTYLRRKKDNQGCQLTNL